MRRRWPLVLLASILGLIGVSLVVNLLSKAELKGAIPSEAPVISLGAGNIGRVVATAQGLFVTEDNRRWAFAKEFGTKPLLVASGAGFIAVRFFDKGITTMLADASFKQIWRETDQFSIGSSIAIGPEESVFVASGGETFRLIRIRKDRSEVFPSPQGGPLSPIALGIEAGARLRFIVGTIDSGVWDFYEGDDEWRQVVGTPTRSILVDEGKILIGTPGGILVSQDGALSWNFTEMREAVSGLAKYGGRYYVVNDSKVILYSESGDKDWRF